MMMLTVMMTADVSDYKNIDADDSADSADDDNW